jgi:tRNA pseudouridine13 synthase
VNGNDRQPLPRGTIKTTPLDFLVDEIPAYEPSGEGSHVYIHFEKTNLTTNDAVRAVARSLDVAPRDIGVAGLKDKIAKTTQWISVPGNDASIDERIANLSIEGLRVLEHRRHGNKLKTGHLKGNRFTIVVRGIEPSRLAETDAALERIAREGVPNAFGFQRFGRDGDNYERARAWLTGRERAPRDPRLRRFHFSAFQSAIFNTVLEHRVKEGNWNVPILGDLLKKEETGGMFVCTDVQLDRERADRGELCPTGPIVGDRMRQPENEAFELEQRITAPLIEGIDLRRARSLGEGTRRGLLLRVAELSHSPLSPMLDSSVDEQFSSEQATAGSMGSAIMVRFVLPKGAYATTVLENVFSIADAESNSSSREESNGERGVHTLTGLEEE